MFEKKREIGMLALNDLKELENSLVGAVVEVYFAMKETEKMNEEIWWLLVTIYREGQRNVSEREREGFSIYFYFFLKKRYEREFNFIG